MKLLMNEKRPELRAKFGKAFYWLVDALKISDKDFKVQLRIISEKPDASFEFSPEGIPSIRIDQNFGGVNKHIFKGNILKMELNEFRNTCNCKNCRDDPTKNKDMLETLVHEMTHVKQMVEGRLIVIGDYVLWEGKTIHKSELPSYKDQPWEHEANATERKIYPALKRYLENAYA